MNGFIKESLSDSVIPETPISWSYEEQRKRII
jgi:hypothetical protein